MRTCLGKSCKIVEGLKGQIIVSCQASEDEPLYGSGFMVQMAKAAQLGGAGGIRANSVEDIKAIRQQIDLPVIGIIKRKYEGSECYITTTMREVDELVEFAEPHIIAVDGTGMSHPGGISGHEFISEIKAKYPDILLMADISTYDEGINAEIAGADLVSTALSGYTSYSPNIEEPDFELMLRLSRSLSIPVIGEGRIWCPEEIRYTFELRVHAVVVGTAITRPLEITKRFVQCKNDHTQRCFKCYINKGG